MARLAASHSAFEVMNTTFVCTFLRCCLSGLLRKPSLITRHQGRKIQAHAAETLKVERSKPTQLKQRAAELGRKHMFVISTSECRFRWHVWNLSTFESFRKEMECSLGDGPDSMPHNSGWNTPIDKHTLYQTLEPNLAIWALTSVTGANVDGSCN